MSDDLEERMLKFKTLELPGQPKMMHMGTVNLVDDLWREILRLRRVVDNRSSYIASGESGEAD